MRSRSTSCYVTVRPGWRSAQFGLLSRVLAAPGRLCRWKRSLSALLRTLPRLRIAEVSQFALSKQLRAVSACSGSLARLALVRGIVQLSACMRLTHWCALMEPKLLRLLGTSGIHFMPMAGLVEHHGLRQPSVVGLPEMLERVYREKPAVWEFITDGGMFWRAGRAPYAA